MPPRSSREAHDPLSDLALWRPIVDPKRLWHEGSMRLICRTYDPALVSPRLDMDTREPCRLLLRMSAIPARDMGVYRYATGGLYAATQDIPDFSESCKIEFSVPLDGQRHDYEVPLSFALPPEAKISQLRFDPLDCPGICEVSFFRIAVISSKDTPWT